MGRYILSHKIAKMLTTRKYMLVCKICDCPFHAGLSLKEAIKEADEMGLTGDKRGEHIQSRIGDEIESKQQRRGKSKLYHGKCYDDSEFETNGNGNGDNGDEAWIQKGDKWILKDSQRRRKRK